MKPTAWYDPTNGAVSTDKDSPLFTPLGQLLPLYTQQEDDGITLNTIRHPRGKPALGNLNPESLETMEIDVPEPVAIYRAGQTKGEVYHVQFLKEMAADEVLLYAAPVRRTWVGLTKEERNEFLYLTVLKGAIDFAKACEAKLKEKNSDHRN